MTQDPWAIDALSGAPAYSAQEARLASLAAFAGVGASLGLRSGVRLAGSTTELLVQAQATPNMTVKVNTGQAVVQGATSSTQGAYIYTLDTTTTLTIAAAHATLDRTDLVCVRVRDANVDTSGQRDGSVMVVTGTNGGGVPSVPTDATYLVLAQVAVVHAVTSITSGAITDKRPFAAALGGVLPFVSTARPTNCMDGQPGWETDTSLGYTYSSSLAKWLRREVDIVTTNDQSWTSTIAATALSNTYPAGGFAFTVEANCRYVWNLDCHIIGQTSVGLAANQLQPTGSRTDWLGNGLTSAGSAYNGGSQNQTGTTNFLGTFTTANFQVVGVTLIGATPGTVSFTFAQGTSNAATSWVLTGSRLRVRQVS